MQVSIPLAWLYIKKLYLTSPGASLVIYDLNVLLVLPGFCLKVFVTRFVILLACSHGFY